METKTEDAIVLTEKAIKKIINIIEEENIPSENYLRIGVKGGGCSGLTYAMGFDKNLRENDTVLEYNNLKVVVDPKSLFHLSGTVLDYSDGLNGKGFVFNNPNAKKTCGCGESFGV